MPPELLRALPTFLKLYNTQSHTLHAAQRLLRTLKLSLKSQLLSASFYLQSLPPELLGALLTFLKLYKTQSLTLRAVQRLPPIQRLSMRSQLWKESFCHLSDLLVRLTSLLLLTVLLCPRQRLATKLLLFLVWSLLACMLLRTMPAPILHRPAQRHWQLLNSMTLTLLPLSRRCSATSTFLSDLPATHRTPTVQLLR